MYVGWAHIHSLTAHSHLLLPQFCTTDHCVWSDGVLLLIRPQNYVIVSVLSLNQKLTVMLPKTYNAAFSNWCEQVSIFLFQKYKKPKFIQCFVFSLTGDVLTGDSEGNILTWGKSAADIKTLGKGAKGQCCNNNLVTKLDEKLHF